VHTREKPFMVREVFDGGGLHPWLEKKTSFAGIYGGYTRLHLRCHET
jgi:hypothetical protein